MKSVEGSTVIGRSVAIRGELSGQEDLYMDGDIEGSIKLTDSTLTIGPNASVVADISARDVIVMGSVAGNLNATGRVELRQTSSVLGDIFAARLSIEDNATLKGRVELRSSNAHSAAATQENLVLEPKA